MIIWITTLIAVAIIHGIGQAIDGVLTTRESNGLASIVYPIGGHTDTRRNIVVGNNNEIMRSVVRRPVFLTKTNSFDGAERTRIGIGYPSCELADTLPHQKLNAK